MIARSVVSKQDIWSALAAPFPTSLISWRQDGRTIARDGRRRLPGLQRGQPRRARHGAVDVVAVREPVRGHHHAEGDVEVVARGVAPDDGLPLQIGRRSVTAERIVLMTMISRGRLSRIGDI